HEGLYFESYDPDGVISALEGAIQQGAPKASMAFSSGAYDQAVYALFTQGEVHTLLELADSRTQAGLDLTQSVWYTRNDDRHSLSIAIPY
ncbi:MAG: hypothetical protein IKK50_06525, partial [Ruminiclostridium sp.]|nr:hypothetical protein [Ruminiclostridium sp.]